MSIDQKAAEYVKTMYEEPYDVLETYEAYKDGYNDGKKSNDWTVILPGIGIGIMIGFIISILLK